MCIFSLLNCRYTLSAVSIAAIAVHKMKNLVQDSTLIAAALRKSSVLVISLSLFMLFIASFMFMLCVLKL